MADVGVDKGSRTFTDGLSAGDSWLVLSLSLTRHNRARARHCIHADWHELWRKLGNGQSQGTSTPERRPYTACALSSSCYTGSEVAAGFLEVRLRRVRVGEKADGREDCKDIRARFGSRRNVSVTAQA
jgi:hypothetical protein